jgi:hypothetical protein
MTVELTRRRESKHPRQIILVEKHAPAARVQRFVMPCQQHKECARLAFVRFLYAIESIDEVLQVRRVTTASVGMKANER